jgi:capsular polysaccharide export protein
LVSFAKHSSAQTHLVIKQHPHARGGACYRALIRRAANNLQISGRVHYLVEGDTADLARGAKGVVLINSTVGLLALEAGVPLKAMGTAQYNRSGLTDQQTLDDFWRSPTACKPLAVMHFIAQLKNLTQVPCRLYADREVRLSWTPAKR